jgi:hypothetical protein
MSLFFTRYTLNRLSVWLICAENQPFCESFPDMFPKKYRASRGKSQKAFRHLLDDSVILL